MKKTYILFLILLLNSCYTLKPDSSRVSEKNYNDKQEITNPQFVKRRNAIGFTFQVVTPIVAGAAMYEYVDPLVKYQDGTETKGFQPANAAIGVIGMLAINKIFNYALGQNKEISPTEKSIKKWMEKTDLYKNYNFVLENNNSLLSIIPKSNETNYIVKNLEDVNYFKKLYPMASNTNETRIIQNAIPILEQEDLASLINLYPQNSAVYPAKTKYVETARNYEELIERKNIYKDAKVDFEDVTYKLITKVSEQIYSKKSGSSLIC